MIFSTKLSIYALLNSVLEMKAGLSATSDSSVELKWELSYISKASIYRQGRKELDPVSNCQW